MVRRQLRRFIWVYFHQGRFILLRLVFQFDRQIRCRSVGSCQGLGGSFCLFGDIRIGIINSRVNFLGRKRFT
jgi:hypothetical protein